MKCDPAMILEELSNPFESTTLPEPNVSTRTPPTISSAEAKPSRILFAEFRRRKVEAGATPS